MIDFINYNWMPTIADHCLDLPEDFYRQAGVSRLHDIDSINPEEVKENDIVFIKTDFVHNGLFTKEILPKIKNKFTLITGISSYTVDNFSDEIVENEFVKYWFCTNPSDIDSDKLIPLPIGFEEKERDGGNQDVLNNHHNYPVLWQKKNSMIYLPYHTPGTNPERDQVIQFLSSLDYVTIEKQKLPFDEYLRKMAEYRYVICLPGAGEDTHRNYEALLSNSMPIMLKRRMKKLYDFYNLPAIFLDNWTEMEWARLQIDAIYDNPEFNLPINTINDFLNVKSHKERILEYAKN